MRSDPLEQPPYLGSGHSKTRHLNSGKYRALSRRRRPQNEIGACANILRHHGRLSRCTKKSGRPTWCARDAGEPTLIYIDRHLIHEVTSAQAFAGLEAAGRPVRRPDLTFAVMDHSVPTKNRDLPVVDQDARLQFEALERNCKRHGILLFDMASRNQGIVHVIGPELGITQPGLTIVCGDSHTSTHGAFGALAFGIGTSEVEHVLATQCLQQTRSKTMHVVFQGASGRQGSRRRT